MLARLGQHSGLATNWGRGGIRQVFKNTKNILVRLGCETEANHHVTPPILHVQATELTSKYSRNLLSEGAELALAFRMLSHKAHDEDDEGDESIS